MAILATLTSNGTIQITNTDTGVIEYLNKSETWSVRKDSDSASLYVQDREVVTIYTALGQGIGNSIFGITNPNLLTDSVINSSIVTSGGGGGGSATVNPSDVSDGIGLTTLEPDLAAIKNGLTEKVVVINPNAVSGVGTLSYEYTSVTGVKTYKTLAGVTVVPTSGVRPYYPVNRYFSKQYKAITTDLVNDYWRVGENIQYAATESNGVLLQKFSNNTRISSPLSAANLTILAPNSPIPGVDILPFEDQPGSPIGQSSTLATQIGGLNRTTGFLKAAEISAAGSTPTNAVNDALVVTVRDTVFSKITDGTNTVAVKAASTSPALADPALVVALSGNSPTYGSLIANNIATRSELVAGMFNSTSPTLTNGQMVPIQLNANGAVKTEEVLTTTSRTQSLPAISDTSLPVNSRVRSIVFTNTSATVIFMQIHTVGVALVTGNVPGTGVIYRIPANTTFSLGVGDYGEKGTLFGASTRIGLSSTFGTYTAVTVPNLALCSLSIETV